MNLTELLAFTAKVQAESAGVNPDDVKITASSNGKTFRKLTSLSATLPSKQITYEQAQSETTEEAK